MSDIYNFIEIDGSTATAGQPSEEQFQVLRDAGYEVVVNLAPDGLDTSLADECGLLGSLGFDYHHIPVPWSAPDLDHLDRFIAAMDAAAGRRTLVHCQANYRVTAFYALYASQRLGWSEEQADALIARIWKSRPDFEMDDVWKSFITAARSRNKR
jgi:protein tyrosine phosphatase (PTP) superfamily phosphohydrolase (DUF442 family)